MRRPRPIALVCLALAAAGCASDIDTARNPTGILVVTYRAPGADLSTAVSFSAVSRLGLVTGATGATGPTFLDAPAVVSAVAAAMAAQGLVDAGSVDPAAPPATPVPADLAVGISALGPPQLAPVDYWVASAEHLGPATFGLSASGWSYPWSWVPVGIRGGSLLVEVADLRGATGAGPAPVAWAFIAHRTSPAETYDTPDMLDAVRRAFAQSPPLAGAGGGVP